MTCMYFSSYFKQTNHIWVFLLLTETNQWHACISPSGLDEKIQEEELVKIADNRKQMINVRQYDQLKTIFEVLNSEYCNAGESFVYM